MANTAPSTANPGFAPQEAPQSALPGGVRRALKNGWHSAAPMLFGNPAALAWRRARIDAARFQDVGSSEDATLRGLESHGRFIGEPFNRLESMVIEAVKPG
jgi:hypothetical protein